MLNSRTSLNQFSSHLRSNLSWLSRFTCDQLLSYKKPGDQWATISFDQSLTKHGPHCSSSCNAIATPYPETTARLYDYADDAQDEKKNKLKRNIGLFLDLVNAKETIMCQYISLILEMRPGNEASYRTYLLMLPEMFDEP
jgi:hypothetical protein